MISGKTLQHVAKLANLPMPLKPKNAKGWIGELIEKSLGATAGNLPEPDFQHLGIELKTIPLNENNVPRESTYVCTVTLTGQETKWDASLVKRKLSRVLWVPVEAAPAIPFNQRRIGSAILWSPSAEDEKILMTDWEELMELVNMGHIADINARYGRYLQIRPKAADARSLCKGVDDEGNLSLTLPRGFYLRTLFTRKILSSIGMDG